MPPFAPPARFSFSSLYPKPKVKAWNRSKANRLTQRTHKPTFKLKTTLLQSGLILLLSICGLHAQSVIRLDAASPGRTFEGIGAVSAGASSRLLIDYPEPQRSQILDYLFKPNYGAGFQHLKVEVGSDMNSTDGTEPSHMRSRDEENDNRGYEWWLMEEAKKRNPDIILDCLAWGAPSWIGGGKFYSQDMADYYVKFIQAAKKVHGLDIDYVGIWNERGYDKEWIKLFRKTLDNAGLQRVGIAAADNINNWGLIGQLEKDPELKSAIHAVAVHYSSGKSTPAAISCGLPLWSSEDGPWSGSWGATCSLAQRYNRNYITGKLTKTEIWSPVSSYYDNLPLSSSGVMRANTPWSGSYEVQPAVWGTAPTTQFAKPGWRYLDSACQLIQGGSVVALESPDKNDFSVIIETTQTSTPQTLAFEMEGISPKQSLHIWKTNSKEQFVEQAPVEIKDGKFQIQAEPGSIYSLTTLTSPHKGDAVPPPPQPFPASYTDDFESYQPGATPRYFSDFGGAFEVVRRADQKGNALRQVVLTDGIVWDKNPYPETFIGDTQWKNYEISADVLVEKSGFASLFGRVGRIEQNENPPWGFWLKVDTTGKWELATRQEKDVVKGGKVKKGGEQIILASGEVPFAADVWHSLKLKFQDDKIDVVIDGKAVGGAESKLNPAGMVGIGSGWHGAQFDNVAIRPD